MRKSVAIGAKEFAALILTTDLDRQPADVQRLIRYVLVRVGLDAGLLLLVGQDHLDGVDRLICTLQEDGSCYVVERPPGWGMEEEARYVAPAKEILGGA